MNRSFLSVSARRTYVHFDDDSADSESSGDTHSGGKLPLCDTLLSNISSREFVAFDDAHGYSSLNEAALLELCDAARAGLAKGNTPEDTAEKAMNFLKAAAKDETYGISTIEIATVRNARMDKLLADLLSPERHVAASPTHMWKDLATAERLQRQWRARFREKYFDLDQTRYLGLTKTGHLRDVVFDDRTNDDRHLWRARHCEALSEGEGNLQYEAG
ncbi:Uncharacterized protein TPAR_05767 [Tolypocladium paradoxum]|uniref:Uncharacterized protein n=1 Tax=Tolypocladium paradoxum TaxID=94208 RepID=A0A2S4KV65_9HYPO|nr:Uncharacterized protein TPAR_05767 [Tolypocladium paradoxum]